MSQNQNSVPRILDKKILGESRLFQIEQLELQFANGQRAQFERIRAKAGKAVMIVAVNQNRECVLVQEYAAGTERYELQCPKGMVDAGEDSFQAAQRELREETGFAAGKLEVLTTLRVSPGYFDHETDVVLATELYPSPLHSGDEPEPLSVHRFKLTGLTALFQRDDFSEARSVAALLLASRVLGL